MGTDEFAFKRMEELKLAPFLLVGDATFEGTIEVRIESRYAEGICR